MLTNNHAPLFLKAPSAKGLVVFTHGFMGSPRQFDDLADAVHKEGFSAVELLLPGHGSTLEAFHVCKFQQWQDHLNAEIESYMNEYTDIWLVGHSMGGLLSLSAADKFSNDNRAGVIRGVFTIASPFKLTMLSGKALRVRLIMIFAKHNNPVKRAYLDDDSVPVSLSLIWRINKPFNEVKKLMNSARLILGKISTPVFAVYSVSDETVPKENLGILESELKNAPFDSLLLQDSLHAYYTKSERQEIEKALLRFVAV